jgi:uncharacterized membrane protein
MAEIQESIEVDVPASVAYNQWTQFEEFPQFMENVESVRQLDDTHVRWVAELAGRRHEWEAEITYQDPDRHIAWRATDGKNNTGWVRFNPLADDRVRVTAYVSWEPEGIEAVADAVGVDDRGVKADLKRFKQLVESRGRETGAWRGEVKGGEVAS